MQTHKEKTQKNLDFSLMKIKEIMILMISGGPAYLGAFKITKGNT